MNYKNYISEKQDWKLQSCFLFLTDITNKAVAVLYEIGYNNIKYNLKQRIINTFKGVNINPLLSKKIYLFVIWRRKYERVKRSTNYKS